MENEPRRFSVGIRRSGSLLAALAVIGLAIVVLVSVRAEPPGRSTIGEAHSTSHKTHRIVIQVSQSDPAVMNLALNNTENLVKFYKDKGEKVDIEIVAYGAGLNMVRSDTSPVKERLAAIAGSMKNVTFSGCGNTLANQSRQESRQITLVPEAHIVPAGIERIVELEEQGWTYVRP